MAKTEKQNPLQGHCRRHVNLNRKTRLPDPPPTTVGHRAGEGSRARLFVATAVTVETKTVDGRKPKLQRPRSTAVQDPHAGLRPPPTHQQPLAIRELCLEQMVFASLGFREGERVKRILLTKPRLVAICSLRLGFSVFKYPFHTLFQGDAKDPEYKPHKEKKGTIKITRQPLRSHVAMIPPLTVRYCRNMTSLI